MVNIEPKHQFHFTQGGRLHERHSRELQSDTLSLQCIPDAL